MVPPESNCLQDSADHAPNGPPGREPDTADGRFVAILTRTWRPPLFFLPLYYQSVQGSTTLGTGGAIGIALLARSPTPVGAVA
jgi:hypothetical protein